VRRLEERGVIQGYRAVIDHNAVGMPLIAFISVTPTDPSAPDDVPDRLRDIGDIEACYSVAGDESYILKARVSTPGDLEDLLAQVRSSANVSTRSTVVLSTPWEERSHLTD
jgi:Lrp/AsnC family leucine-responsive transcriptional regulator